MREEAPPLPVPAHVAPGPAQAARGSSGRLRRRRRAVGLASEQQSHAPQHQNEQQTPGTRVVPASHFIFPRQSRVNPKHTQAGRAGKASYCVRVAVPFRNVASIIAESGHMGQENIASIIMHHPLFAFSPRFCLLFLVFFNLSSPPHFAFESPAVISRSHVFFFCSGWFPAVRP